MEIAPGLVGEIEITVAPADTADALGNAGVHVLATPRLVALLEAAAIRAVEPALGAGAGTVGTRVDVRHLAATPFVHAHAGIIPPVRPGDHPLSHPARPAGTSTSMGWGSDWSKTITTSISPA